MKSEVTLLQYNVLSWHLFFLNRTKMVIDQPLMTMHGEFLEMFIVKIIYEYIDI